MYVPWGMGGAGNADISTCSDEKKCLGCHAFPITGLVVANVIKTMCMFLRQHCIIPPKSASSRIEEHHPEIEELILLELA